jgi:hypothetical protein
MHFIAVDHLPWVEWGRRERIGQIEMKQTGERVASFTESTPQKELHPEISILMPS